MLTDAGRVDLLRVVTGQVPADTYWIGLFTNAHTITETTVLADLVELNVAGYFRQGLGGFGDPFGPIAGVWSCPANAVVFRNLSSADAPTLGYFFVGTARNVFYGGGNFPIPFVVPKMGSKTLTPIWTDTGA